MLTPLFRPAADIERTRSSRHAVWWTWSDPVRCTLDKLGTSLSRIPAPPLVHLRRAEEYDYTYTLSPGDHLSRELVREIRSIAAAFLAFDPGKDRWMFRDLLQRSHPKKLLHVFFAMIRDSMVNQTNEPMSAMYAPLGTVGTAAGEFRLHADLYIPTFLFNVFDDVPEDGTGASTFLSIRSFKSVLKSCELLPRSSRLEIQRLFGSGLKTDGYERFIWLVHNENNAWRDQLWEGMERTQEMVSLRRGEGYLLNDRFWLHGRTQPSNEVSRFRVHRLVFGKRDEFIGK
jgi:hypothetical protein